MFTTGVLCTVCGAQVYFLVCCGCDTPYIVSVHVQYQASIYICIYTFVVSRAFMAGAASQAGDADSLRGTWSHLWFAGVRECPPWCSVVGALVTVHQFFCILHLAFLFYQGVTRQDEIRYVPVSYIFLV